MAQLSTIEWTDATWNPVTGCVKIGAGCKNCYAERFAERWRGIPDHPYEQGFDLRLWDSRLKQPLKWKKPRMIFVNSMSDLFQKNIERTFIDSVFDTMEEASWHVFQVLTKRSSLMRNYVKARYGGGQVPNNIWLGISVEDRAHTGRIKHLKQINSKARFISFEPLLNDVGAVNLKGIAWAIVGGESGPRARKMEAVWAKHIRDICRRDDVAFFLSNGAVCAQSQVGACLMARNGMVFLTDFGINKMAVNKEHYTGREQTYIKHLFLVEYLEAAAYKIMQSSYESFNFIDAFSGPWKVKDKEKYTDTSFDQALKTLEKVSRILKIPNDKIHFYFCESNKKSFKHLEEYAKGEKKFGIQAFHGRFEDNIEEIQKHLGGGFTFTFIDPTGWNIDCQRIFDFLKQNKGEFLINFMSEDIGRHVSFDKVSESFGRFLVNPEWREEYNQLLEVSGRSSEECVLFLFKRTMKEAGIANYLPDLKIQKPNQNRLKMRLILGTKHPEGVKVFRDVHRKVKASEIDMRTQGLFEEFIKMRQDLEGVGSPQHEKEAKEKIIELLQNKSICFKDIMIQVLELIPIRETQVKDLCVDLKKERVIEFTLPPRTRKPQDETMITLL